MYVVGSTNRFVRNARHSIDVKFYVDSFCDSFHLLGKAIQVWAKMLAMGAPAVVDIECAAKAEC